MLYIFKIFIVFSSKTSPQAAAGTHGGQIVSVRAHILPSASSVFTVSVSEKNAARISIAFLSGDIENDGGISLILGIIILQRALLTRSKSLSVFCGENISIT